MARKQPRASDMRTHSPARKRPREGRRVPRRSRRAVVYIFGRFPTVSETFLLREITALARLGLRIYPVALAQPRERVVHEQARPWVEQGVIYRPPLGAAGLWYGNALVPLMMPAGWRSAALMALGLIRRYPLRAREILVSLLSAAYFAWRLPRSQVGHIHATFASVPATVGVFLAELLGVSYSFACHARDVFTDEASFLELKAQEAEFMVACSEVAYRALQQRVPMHTHSRLHLVRHGLDLARYAPPAGRYNTVPQIMSAGRLVPKKGFVYLLRAAARLAGRDHEFEMHIFGDGPQEEDLRRLINALQLSHCVHMHGAVPEGEMLQAYRRADLFALASVQGPDGDNEGVPNVLVEALAMQVPVVASRTGGIPELIQDGVTGLLAEPGDHMDLADKMERLLVDEGLRSAVIAAGRLRVEREYDLHRNAARLYELFRPTVR